MKTNAFIKLTFAVLLSSAFSIGAVAQTFRVVGYVPNWISVATFANSFDYSKVSHINFAFQNPNSAGIMSESSTGLSTLVTKAHAAGVKVLISLGGAGSASDATLQGYYFNLIKSANRTAFVQKISAYVDQYNLDGVDVDLEGSAINSDYDGFITALVASMHGNNRGKLVTAALKHDYGGNNVLNSTLQKFDFINVMAYDATGSWNNTPGQHSSMSYAQTALAFWTNKGLSKSKMTLGLPFYGYGWNGDAGNKSYSTIMAKYSSAWNSDVIGNIIYYNGVATIKSKTTYAKNNGYGGVMIWELSNDVSGQYSLLAAINSVATPYTSAEELSAVTAASIYPNPATEVLRIQSDIAFSSVEIFDLAGMTVLQSTARDIDVQNIAVGVYVLKMSTATGEVFYHKFVKN